MSSQKNLVIEDIDENVLNVAFDKVLKDKTYGNEYKLVKQILKKYPANKDYKIVAMKIALIDVVNSTHLYQYKSKINLHELAMFISSKELNFDKRVKIGDDELVNDIAQNTGKVNLFSFASKYCHYHNSILYKRDDYAKYDGIVHDCLPLYAKKYNIKYNNKKIGTTMLNDLRKSFNYHDFNNIINSILKDISLKNKKAKFDAVMWYYNRSEQNKADNA